MHTFAVGQWPAKSGGTIDAVEANDVHGVPAALAKRELHEGKAIIPSRAGRYPGVLIGGVQHRIFDLKIRDELEELSLIFVRIAGGQGEMN